MKLEIRVSSNRWCEMRIKFESKTKVAERNIRIIRLCHLWEKKVRITIEIDRIRYAFEKFPDMSRLKSSFFSLIADFCNIHCMISVCSFPGRPWTRERNGILLLLHHLATSSLVSTINSSMSLWASFLSRFLICRGTFSLDSDRFYYQNQRRFL